MRIEAVSVCVEYDDYAAWTIPQNKKFFDDYIIVTSLSDEKTAKLCRHYNVKCIQTSILEGCYNKASAINLGLDNLSRKEWMIQLDVDIYLPERFRKLVEIAKLDKSKIYGIDRLNVVGFDKWINHLSDPNLLYENEIYLHQWDFRGGSRVVKTWKEPDFVGDIGWIPLGYFQMFCDPEGEKVIYPDHVSEDYARSDMAMACQWSRDKRELIPEIIGLHLMGKYEIKGCNWTGRKSPRFDLTELQP